MNIFSDKVKVQKN